jgi:hypothetical protein
MKRLVSPLLIVLLLSSLSLGWRTTPRYLSPDDRLYSTESMTLADKLLLVSDVSGLHIYDISDLSAPRKVMRIRLGSNKTSAVKDDIIYTNDYNQLKAIRLSGDSFAVVDSIGNKYPVWNEGPMDGYEGGGCSACFSSYDPAPAPTGTSNSSSYATFAVIDNYLYRAYDGRLITYDVSTPDKLKRIGSTDVGWYIQSMYPSENLLFLGGFAGMQIFDRSQPEKPVRLSQIEHTRACDPVVVSGSTAYITLRGSGLCGGAEDELLCVSIQNPAKPSLIGAKPLPTPWGLAVQNQKLFVSHGEYGYSLLDVTDPSAPAVTATWMDRPTRDFIWSGNTLFVMSRDNVYIYDVTDPATPVFLSQVQDPASM